IGMKFRSMQALANVFRDIGQNLRVAAWGVAIEADETRPDEKAYIAENPVVLGLLGKGIKSVANGIRRNGLRETIKCGHARVVGVLRDASTRFVDSLLNAARAYCDLHLAQARAGNGQHQRRCIAKVALELDGAGSLRKLVVQRAQLEID